MCPFIMREEVEHFVAKDGSTTRLQHNNRNFRFDFRGQGIKRLQQQPLGTIYNFGRIQTMRIAPAFAAGLADQVLSLEEIVLLPN